MKLAFHGATTMTSDLETDVHVTSQAGYNGLEVWAKKVDRYLATHPLITLRRLFQDLQVKPIAFNSIEFIAFRGEGFVQIKDRLKELGKIAQAIGCETIVVVPSPTPGRDIPWSDILEEYVRILRELCDIAHPYNVNLSFEFLGFGWCSVRTPRAAFEIIQKVDRVNLGLTIDAAHFYCGGAQMNELDVVDPKRIFLFHLDDLEDSVKEAVTDEIRLLPGLGVVPLDELCSTMRKIGYTGPCSVELFRPEYWEWDPLELAIKAREAALRVLSPHFEIESGDHGEVK